MKGKKEKRSALAKTEKIENQSIQEEVQRSYLDYAMSVIVSRALPDVRDGLKPVQRRILYAMWQMGLRANTKFRKSALVVGEVLGKYHPHGDSAVYETMVRMAQDFSLGYPLVQGQGNFGCFTKDTKVKLCDGKDVSFEDLIKEQKEGKKHWTFTFNTESKKIEITEIKNPRLTRKNEKIIEVTLDNGEKIKCTLDHLFMLKDGSYRQAKGLEPGDSLMPLYTKLYDGEGNLNLKGYETIYQPTKNGWEFIHHLADKWNLNNGIYKKSAGKIRHHRDFNKLNNNPDNVLRIQWQDHWKYHREIASERHKNNPEYVKKIAEGRQNFWADAKNRRAYSERLTKRNLQNWGDKNYREKMIKTLSEVNKKYFREHPEAVKILSKRSSLTMKRLWKIPKYRELFHEKIVASNKRRETNLTGKRKFLKICYYLCEKEVSLNKVNFEKIRKEIFGTKSFTSWDLGIEKYYNNNQKLLWLEIGSNRNHKVAKARVLSQKEDVYDLTVGHWHNFALAAGVFVHNSQDGDAAAAYRYTETRLSVLAQELLFDLEKDTVDWTANYDGTTKEPIILPGKLPNLLINGASGIAVGVATNIPPHNLGEVCDAGVYLIDNPKAEIADLIKFIHGPDFPTGGIIYSVDSLEDSYRFGKGKIIIRAKTEIVGEDTNNPQIIISEIPYMVQKGLLLEKIAELVQEKKIQEIKNIRDLSNKEGIKIIIDLKKGTSAEKALNRLFHASPLEVSFHFNFLALVDGLQVKSLSLRSMLEYYLEHRKIVVRRRTEWELNKVKKRIHILEGFEIALLNIDRVIKIIKESKDKDAAKVNLMKSFKLSEEQTLAILELRLWQLSRLESQKIKDELKDLKQRKKMLEEILTDAKKILEIIKDELKEIKDKYSQPRRTKIIKSALQELKEEDLIHEQPTIVTITNEGYIKRVSPDQFRVQERGGKGTVIVKAKEGDILSHLIFTSTVSELLFFTDQGKLFKMKTYDISEKSKNSKGDALINFLSLASDEKVSAVLPKLPKNYFSLTGFKESGEQKFLLLVTQKGIIKRVKIEEFDKSRKNGLIAINLDKDDRLVDVKPSTGEDEIFLITRYGHGIRFKEKEARHLSRGAKGIKGMKLAKDDEIIALEAIPQKKSSQAKIFTITEHGYGKASILSSFRLQKRAGSGIKIHRVSDKTGKITHVFFVDEKNLPKETMGDLIIASLDGQLLRIQFKNVPSLGRVSQGVRLIRFKDKNDKVSSVALI